ncbi:11642_t:CDS:2 [Entrophospora sp. SA101]|nr:11637_t:CDS:2 [Entrophospora sp. SA101]CAJ0837898.1 11642_t:CDS:2 [Entrophospora sp. SA101]
MIRELGNLSYEVQGSQEQNQANRLSHCAQYELKGFNKLKGEIDEKERVICHNILRYIFNSYNEISDEL